MAVLREGRVIGHRAIQIEAQFKASPTIDPEMLEAAIAAMEAHESMGVQVINSARVRAGLKNLLLNNLNLYDDLRSEVVLGS